MKPISEFINKVHLGNCLDIMKEMPAESVDCIVTDPPYGIEFMGKDWDKAIPSLEIFKECVRVLKSGAFMFCMSSPRQDVHWRMMQKIEYAGFRIDVTDIEHAYASGFPKAMNIGKSIDKRLGV